MTAVLVVEDEPALARLMARALTRAGCGVGVAHTLGEARAAVAAAVPEVVVLDLRLPDGDGTDLLDEPALAGVRVVVATAETDPALHRRCLEAGATAVVLKPFDLAALTSLVARAAHGS